MKETKEQLKIMLEKYENILVESNEMNYETMAKKRKWVYEKLLEVVKMEECKYCPHCGCELKNVYVLSGDEKEYTFNKETGKYGYVAETETDTIVRCINGCHITVYIDLEEE